MRECGTGARMSTKIDSRAKAIMRVVLQAEEISVEGLAKQIRRDLARLEKRGFVLRTRGGAKLPAPLFYRSFQHDHSIQRQQLQFAEQKRRIGFAASELICEGETIGLTAGSTTTQIGRAIRHRRCISVVTNALNIAMELSHQSAIKTALTGGVLADGSRFAVVRESAVSFLKEIYLDKVFLGVSGIDPRDGATALDREEADISEVMIRQSSQVIVVSDSSKVNRISPVSVCPCSAIDVLVTDTGISKDACEAFRAQGVRVICA
jgi:DeoR family transcriptional regulator of aga operon